MFALQNYIHQALLICGLFFLIFFSSSCQLFADEIEWLEVSKTNNELLSINPSSIKYNNKGFLLVIAKHSDFNPDDQTIKNNDSFKTQDDHNLSSSRLFLFVPTHTCKLTKVYIIYYYSNLLESTRIVYYNQC